MYPFIFALAADQRQQAEHSTRGITWQSALSDANKTQRKDIMLWLDPVQPLVKIKRSDDGAHSGLTDKNRHYSFSAESPH